MKTKLSLAALLSSVLWAGSQLAYAGATWSSVTVLQVWPCSSVQSSCGTNGSVQVEFSAVETGGATCGSTNKQWGVIDISNNSGYALYSAMLNAMILGQTVSALGTGTCGIVSNIETIYTVKL